MMKNKRETRGGARTGAGRKAAPGQKLTIRVEDSDIAELKKLGITNLSAFYAEAGKTLIVQKKAQLFSSSSPASEANI